MSDLKFYGLSFIIGFGAAVALLFGFGIKGLIPGMVIGAICVNAAMYVMSRF